MATLPPLERYTPNQRKNRMVASIATGAFLFMLGLSFAAVPLYDMFCRATGYGGTTMVATRGPDRVAERQFVIRLDSNVAPGLGWVFEPEIESLSVRAGEVRTVSYTIRNTRNAASTGIASYNVSPGKTGSYFNKIACFCFTELTLQPGESRTEEVVFFVDPDIVKNSELDALDTITLSYTFFPVKTAAKPLADAGSAVTSPSGISARPGAQP